MNYPDIMVDIESTGTQPEHTNIIQIAAYRFNLETGDVDPKAFDQCLIPLPTRFWDEDTRMWWSKMPDVLDGIWSRMKPARQVMEALTMWAVKDNEAASSLRFWGKPTHFDHSFISSYYREVGLPNPFHFRNAIDQNSWIRARYFPEEAPRIEKELDFIGHEHNARDDALHQVRVVLEAYDRTK